MICQSVGVDNFLLKWYNQGMEKLVEKSKNADETYLKVQQLDVLKRQITGGFLMMGKILSELCAEKAWKNYASHLTSFDDFLREIKLGKSTAYNCMRLFSMFGSAPLELDYARLVKALPFITEANKDEWAVKAKELDAHDFHEELREAKGIFNCPHSES